MSVASEFGLRATFPDHPTTAAARSEVKRLLARAFSATSQASLITDARQRILHVSGSFTAITGYDEAELLGQDCRILQGPGSDPGVTAAIRRALSYGESYEGDILNYRKDGSPFWNSLSIRPLRDEAGTITHFVSVQRDVTARMAHQEQLRFQAGHDPVTGLPNRRALDQHLSSRRPAEGAVLAMIDVVALRSINSTFGYEAGDSLLKQLGRRMRELLADGDFLACLGGDLFAVVLENIDGGTRLEDELARLHEAVQTPFSFTDLNQDCTIDLSMGLARITGDGTTGFLFHQADAALRRAREGRPAGPWWTLAPDVPEEAVDRDVDGVGDLPDVGDLSTGRSDREQLFAGGLSMFMQPVLDLRTGRLSRVEALARLTLSDGTVIPPARFLPALDDADLDELFRRGLNEALRCLARWDDGGLSTSVSVNISPSTLRNPDCPRWVSNAMRRHGIAPDRLGLELLETLAVESEVQIEAIDRLLRLGVGLALDDLGSGYSSLQRLFALPFDTIKLDRGLLVEIRSRPVETLSLVSALTQMGRDFGVSVVIEGLEDAGMAEAASVLGVPLGQGYFFARPMPADEVPGWVAGFTFPLRADAVQSALGALAYHWQFLRWASPHPTVLAGCPLTDFISLHSTTAAAARWHAHQHGQAPDPVYGQMLADWLVDLVRDGPLGE
ncbi:MULTISPECIES: bifunctional diguanylate cyclase/phosphodiesterase [unclassified Cryobacterium]|uniref:putative bifunctional diguanylate cyclase/phosphodiesterase n=1 Tax=unclassified Cryobacterium TaxID=2649013 RepID=UPI001068F17C|nr:MULTISPECIES: EAL domain-containing protein [unclassified Cryobacterium]TFD18355.1 EAL domain-containing protein [Cryobacterium sp. TMT2-23]TFD18437.1 EAL domain-containing protein [Cryobacterium sp. TMT4-10]